MKLQSVHLNLNIPSLCVGSYERNIIGLEMQQLHHLDSKWTDNRQKFLHQGTNVLISLIDVVTNLTHLKNY